MTRFGMLIDTTKCVGCYTCRTSCQRQNSLNPGESLIHFEEFEKGTYPHVSIECVPIQCMHCEDAPCQAACPTGATYTSEDGVVHVDDEKCIGCKYCMVVCPYQARIVNEKDGFIDKCRLCAIYYLDGAPNCTCVNACLTGARIAGDLDDPESEISRAIVERNALPLAGDLTVSKIFYVR